MSLPPGLGGALVGLGVEIAQAVLEHKDVDIDKDAWKGLGDNVQRLIERAIDGEDISHDELMLMFPHETRMRVLQETKKLARLAQGLPVI